MKRKALQLIALLGLLLGVVLPATGFAVTSVPKSDLNTQKTGSLTIHALRNIAGMAAINTIKNDGTPLSSQPALTQPMSGVTFTYAAITRDQAKAMGWQPDLNNIGQNVSRDEALDYFKTTTAEKTVTTQTDGSAKVDFTNLNTANPEDNLYLFLETTDPIPAGMVSHPEPFIINVPALNPNYDGSQDKNYYNYDVHIYPKFVLDATSVQFNKVGENSDKLAGARFVIKDSDSGLYLAKDSNGLPVLTNGVPSFTANGQEAGYVFASTKNGVMLTGLPVGKYTIEELPGQPTSGDLASYLPNGKPISFEVTAADVQNNNVIHPLADQNNDFVNYKKPVIEKEVSEPSQDQFAPVNFTLTMNIPGDIGNYQDYAVKDNLSDKLDFSAQSIPAVAGITLAENTDYTFSATSPLTWTFTPAGRQKLQQIYDAGTKEFKIQLTAIPNDKAAAGSATENDGAVDYDNNYAPEGTTESNKVYTIFGGVNFKKVDDMSGKTLAGATFVVQRTKDSKVTYLLQTAGKNEWVTDQSKATAFTSDANGGFSVNGLAYTHKVTFDKDGNATEEKEIINHYALVETAAPAGYNLLNKPLAFTVGNQTETKTIEIPNAQHSRFPMTGGTASTILMVVGVVLLAGGFLVYKKNEA